jgi:hypothetical protein
MEEEGRAQVLDARSLVLPDGTLIRIAGLEPFSLLFANAEAAEAALTERLKELVAGRTLKLRRVADSADRYGRVPTLVAVDGGLVQEILAREGLAIIFADGDLLPCVDHILAAEEDARRNGRGFWPEAPVLRAHPSALATRIGRFAIFEGTIVSVGNRRARTYLNFGDVWSRDVTVEIEAGDRNRFGGEEGLAGLAGSTVRVRGFVEEKGGPMVLIRSPMQIEVIRRTTAGEPS